MQEIFLNNKQFYQSITDEKTIFTGNIVICSFLQRTTNQQLIKILQKNTLMINTEYQEKRIPQHTKFEDRDFVGYGCSQDGLETLVDDEYGDFTSGNIIKPFEKKVFYFYLKNLAPKNDFDNAKYVEDLCCKLPTKIIEKHIENLHENVAITPKKCDFRLIQK